LIALFWTYFPYALTARGVLRRRLGESVYLLAKYYTTVHTTVSWRLQDLGGDPKIKGTPAYRLQKTRLKLVLKQLAVLGEMRGHLEFTKYEFSLGGQFPKDQYAAIINKIHSLLEYMSIIEYATTAYSHYSRYYDADSHAWMDDLSRVRSNLEVTSQEISSVLTLLSSSIIGGNALPPYLKSPKPYLLTRRIQELDPDVLSVRHVTESGYAAFAVTQVASWLIHDDISKLLDMVKGLVGEVDFSFHAVGTGDDSDASSLVDDKAKGRKTD